MIKNFTLPIEKIVFTHNKNTKHTRQLFLHTQNKKQLLINLKHTRIILKRSKIKLCKNRWSLWTLVSICGFDIFWVNYIPIDRSRWAEHDHMIFIYPPTILLGDNCIQSFDLYKKYPYLLVKHFLCVLECFLSVLYYFCA